ncbi:MAG: TolC family protein [Bacteroidaceae bacterium]|nr:TolC family protein [Bacteroidaceae bacterium]
MIRKLYIILLSLVAASPAFSQRTLTLDECRQLAVEGNKKIAMERVKGEMTASMRKSAKTLALPRVSAVLGYEHFGREISILNSSQKSMLSNLGTSLTGGLAEGLPDIIMQMVQQGVITQQQAQTISGMMQQSMPEAAAALNAVGNDVVNAFRTDSRDLFAGSVMVTQPVYMGGAINTAKEMAAITEEMSKTSYEQTRQNTIYDIDKAYWFVVQLSHKKQLADKFVGLVGKLNADVKKCIDEGVATRADGLKVSVALNEAQMTQLQVEDGLRLSKMLICQLCGLPISTEITLADEKISTEELLAASALLDTDIQNTADFSNRPELQLLSHMSDMSKSAQKLIKATNRPQVLATAGVLVSNPSIYNGFEKKFGVNWTVGIMARIPIWDWHDTAYKLNAARAATHITELQIEEANELIELQVSQDKFKISEAQRKLDISEKNIEKAEENLRCANLGFSEGVITSTDVMAAQTAWLQAETQRIDAEIELVLAKLSLKKNLGKL